MFEKAFPQGFQNAIENIDCLKELPVFSKLSAKWNLKNITRSNS